MATTIQEALAICNANLTGDLKTDIPYLEGQVRIQPAAQGTAGSVYDRYHPERQAAG